MTVFEKACAASAEEWANSFFEDKDFVFSKKFNKNMAALCDKMRGDKLHRLTRRTARVVLIAAILLSMTVTAFAIPASREYIIKKFTDHSTYEVIGGERVDIDENIKPHYIPEGFKLVNHFYSRESVTWGYEKNESTFFNVDITLINTQTEFDTERYDTEVLEINGIKYIYYKSVEENNGLIWNDGVYIYGVYGTVSKEEIIKIAQNIE